MRDPWLMTPTSMGIQEGVRLERSIALLTAINGRDGDMTKSETGVTEIEGGRWDWRAEGWTSLGLLGQTRR